MMICTFLGTATSHGIPMIGCSCAVCRSNNPKNKRRRSSVWIRTPGASVVIDSSPDFREQALSCGLDRVDALLVTHSHADHIFGFDDLRVFYTMQGKPIDVFGSRETIAYINRTFSYIHAEHPPGVSILRANPQEVSGEFTVGDLKIQPVRVQHGRWEIYAYRLTHDGRSLGYAPDCNGLSDDAFSQLQGLDVMVLDALRRRPHPSHFTLEESLAALARIGAVRGFLTHICHDLEHEALLAEVPPGVAPAYDGLAVEI